MRRTPSLVIMAATVALLLWPALQAGAQGGSYQVQFSYTFTNEEAEPVVGLVVQLSKPAEIMLDENGHAGPFKNIKGNDSKKIIVTNPGTLIPASGDGNKVELTFRTQKKELEISKWWWLDENGKLIGKKKKG